MTNNTDFESIVKIKISLIKSMVIFTASIVFYIFAVFLWQQNTIDNDIVLHFNLRTQGHRRLQ